MSGRNVGLVREAVAALNRGDVERYQAAFAPSCRRWMLGVDEPMLAAMVADTLRDLRRAFRDFHLHEELLLGGDGHVVARWRTSGVHERDYQGVAPTGRSVSVQTCEIYQFEGDHVIATWSYGDPLDLVRQLGGM